MRTWKERIESMSDAWECLIWSAAAALFAAFALWLNDSRFDRAEERILALENKGCLMTGAHTGCKR